MTIFRCLDFETTGFKTDDNAAGIMEAGWTDYLFEGAIEKPHGMLVDCGIPVSIEARAVHHISDAMVAGEPGPDQACVSLMEGEHNYFVAHNIDFEKGFFSGGDIPWICSYKTALRIWPEAPGHKLMELRYFLDLDAADDFDPKLAEPAHRAPADSYVCAHLLRRILAEPAIKIEQLARWSSGPALLYMCFMKKHKGKPWHQVAQDDRPYLDWIYNKSDVSDRDIRATVKYWLNKTDAAHASGKPYP